jgi:hypothetical protein
VDKNVQLCLLGSQRIHDIVEFLLDGYIACEHLCAGSELVRKILNRALLAFALISQNQLAAFSHECLSDRISQTPPVRDAKDQRCLAS